MKVGGAHVAPHRSTFLLGRHISEKQRCAARTEGAKPLKAFYAKCEVEGFKKVKSAYAYDYFDHVTGERKKMQPEAVFDIPPAAFRPMPKCTVSVLRFAPTAAPGGGAGGAWSATQREQLLALLKRTFEQRRKMLRQTLKPLLADAATPIPDDWLTKRPEQLSPLEWVELSSMVFGDSADGGDDYSG